MGRVPAAQRGYPQVPCKFPRGHRFSEEKALNQVYAHAPHALEVGRGLYALGDRTSTVTVGQIKDALTYVASQPVIAAACNELSVDLELDK